MTREQLLAAHGAVAESRRRRRLDPHPSADEIGEVLALWLVPHSVADVRRACLREGLTLAARL